jgi:exopolysaccharide production protein ExoQ
MILWRGRDSVHQLVTLDDEQRKIRFLSFEFLVVLYTVFITSGALNGFFYDFINETGTSVEAFVAAVKAQGDSTNPIRQMILLPLYGYATFYLFRHWKASFSISKYVIPLVIISLMTVLSTFWSLDPEATFRRSINVMGGTFLGLYLALRYTPPQMILLLGRCYLYVCFFTIFIILIDPANSIHHDKHYPALHGYFSHKNWLGNIMTEAAMIALLLMQSKITRSLGRLLFFLTLILVIGSLSRGAWINFVIMFLAFYYLVFLRKLKIIGYLLLLAIVATITITVVYIGPAELMRDFISVMGRDPTMTGRTETWSVVIEDISRNHFWFGYGFESFWTSYRGALSLDWGMGRYIPPHAHNGWIQVMTHLGMIGVILLAFTLIQGMARNFRPALNAKNIQYSFCFLYLMINALENFSELIYLARDHFQWILFVYCVANLSWQKFTPSFQKFRNTRISVPALAGSLHEKQF